MRQDKTLLTLPLDLIQLREDEMILLKGGMSRGVEEPNNGCSSNGGSNNGCDDGCNGNCDCSCNIHESDTGYA